MYLDRPYAGHKQGSNPQAQTMQPIHPSFFYTTVDKKAFASGYAEFGRKLLHAH
jgi:hypothetical protein